MSTMKLFVTGGAGFIGDLARMGSDIEVHFETNAKFKNAGPSFWPDVDRCSEELRVRYVE